MGFCFFCFFLHGGIKTFAFTISHKMPHDDLMSEICQLTRCPKMSRLTWLSGALSRRASDVCQQMELFSRLKVSLTPRKRFHDRVYLQLFCSSEKLCFLELQTSQIKRVRPDFLIFSPVCLSVCHQTATTPVTWSVRGGSSWTATRGINLPNAPHLSETTDHPRRPPRPRPRHPLQQLYIRLVELPK